ncbi:ArsR family transcriptional regulator [Candidatus Woesearchaeota archaeon]|nr:MAG: ArsR family transcriptional regulator [Candidatus Woesearchaeota archaeon]
MGQYELCFETLANELRLAIVKELEAAPKNVTQLANATNAERSRVSHALQILRACRIVSVEKHGREMRYALNTESPVVKHGRGSLFTLMEEHARAHCSTCHKCGTKPTFP